MDYLNQIKQQPANITFAKSKASASPDSFDLFKTTLIQ